MFQIDLYPFYPPLVKVMRPRLQVKHSLKLNVTKTDYFLGL